jgi:hypothetical protein
MGMRAKIIFLFFNLLFFSKTIYAQTETDSSAKKKPAFIISAGFGYPGFATVINSYPNNADKGTYFLKGERIIQKNRSAIGITATLFYSQISYINYPDYVSLGTYKGNGTLYDYKDLGVGIRLNYYFICKNRFNFYLGLGVGGQIPLATYNFPVFAELVLGTRFMFTKKVGLYIEVGAAKAIAQGGLCIKL